MTNNKSSINTWEEFYDYLARPLPNPDKKNLEYLCIWHRSALDKDSTTFNQVCYNDINHPLHKCAYECPKGINYNCKGYRPEIRK